jgi:hypothetical protein
VCIRAEKLQQDTFQTATVDTPQFIASAIRTWQEAMAIRDDAMPILDPEIAGSTFTPGT